MTSEPQESQKAQKFCAKLICVTDRRVCAEPLERRLVELAKAGLKAVQVREKDLPDSEYESLLTKIITALNPFGTTIFVNSRFEIARAHGLHLHLPEDPLNPRPLEPCSPLFSPSRTYISAAVHSVKAARAAERAGADLLIAAPVFQPSSKSAGTLIGVEGLRAICGEVKIPVYALGGVTPLNARVCLDAGASGVACVSALLACADAKRAMNDFQSALGGL